MTKAFIQKVFFLIAINLLVKPIWIFGVERLVQIKVGFESYGLYFALFNFTFLLSLISDLGLSIYNTKVIHGSTNSTVSDTFGLKLLLSVVYLLVAIAVGLLMGYQYQNLLLFLILLSYQLVYSFLGYFRSHLTAHGLFKSDIFISVLDKLLLILLFGFLFSSDFFIGSLGIEFFALSQLIAMGLSLLVCLYLLRKRLNLTLRKIQWKQLKGVLKQLAPYSVFMFLVLAYNKIDSIMLAKLLPDGAKETGNYAAAYRLLDAVSMLPMLFASFFYPLLSKYISRKSLIRKMVFQSAEIMITLSLILAILLSNFAAPIMDLMYGSTSSPTLIRIFSLLIWSIVPIAGYYVFSSALTAKGSLRLLNIIAFASLGLNVILNFVLIEKYKAEGAAVATLISLSLAAIAYSYFYMQTFNLHVSYRLLGKLISLFLILTGSAFLLERFAADWLLQFFLLGLLGLLVSMALKLISIKNLISLIKFTS